MIMEILRFPIPSLSLPRPLAISPHSLSIVVHHSPPLWTSIYCDSRTKKEHVEPSASEIKGELVNL